MANYTTQRLNVLALQWSGTNKDEFVRTFGWDVFDIDEFYGVASILTSMHSYWQELQEGDWGVRFEDGSMAVFTDEGFKMLFRSLAAANV